MIDKFNDNNISFIIRGQYSGSHPSDRNSITFCLIRSIQKFFPDSLIYYVIWKNYSLINNLRIQHRRVKIIEIDDPGGPGFISLKNLDQQNNINRQIVSVKAILDEVKTNYTCIVRSDFLFHNNNLITLYKRINSHKYSSTYKVFEQPILTTFYGSVNSKKNFLSNSPNYPFHPSDIFHFGLTKDIKNLFDIPLMDKADFSYYLSHARGYSKKINKYDSAYLCRYLPEQYLFRKFLVKNRILQETDFLHMEDRPERYENISNKYICNSFFMVSFRELGASWQKKDKRLIKLPKFYFDNRSIYISSAFFHLSRYGYFQRKVSFISRTFLSLTNNAQIVLEIFVIIAYYFIKSIKRSLKVLFEIDNVLRNSYIRYFQPISRLFINMNNILNNDLIRKISNLPNNLSKDINKVIEKKSFKKLLIAIKESGFINKDNFYKVYSFLKKRENLILIQNFITNKKNLIFIKNFITNKGNLLLIKKFLNDEANLKRISNFSDNDKNMIKKYLEKLHNDKDSIRTLEKDLKIYFSKK